MTERLSWDEIKARQAEKDPRTGAQRDASKAAASLRFDVAQLVYDLRTGAGLTQWQLAQRMGTTQSVISRLEQAGRLPTLDLLARVGTATGSDLRLLVRRAGGHDLDVPLSA
jgi:ribosome-binding protein aMBF1 (putative translation factor)